MCQSQIQSFFQESSALGGHWLETILKVRKKSEFAAFLFRQICNKLPLWWRQSEFTKKEAGPITIGNLNFLKRVKLTTIKQKVFISCYKV